LRSSWGFPSAAFLFVTVKLPEKKPEFLILMIFALSLIVNYYSLSKRQFHIQLSDQNKLLLAHPYIFLEKDDSILNHPIVKRLWEKQGFMLLTNCLNWRRRFTSGCWWSVGP